MDSALFERNARRFQRSMERIAEKYSKVQYEHDAVEVDLNNTRLGRLEHYMKLSEKNLDKLESMSFAEESSLQDITQYSEIDTSCKEKSGDFETTSLSEVTQNDAERYAGPRDESQRNYTLLSDQPEDQDEELEVSLQSRGSSLGECYQDMVSQIENAWRRQHVSETADSVRRRYRRWRKSTRMHRAADSFHDVQRHDKETSQQGLFVKHHHSLKSPVKSVTSTVTKAVSPSPVKIVSVNGQKSQYYCSPVRRSEAPVVVMDMSAIDKEFKRAFNKTFTVSEPSLLDSTFASGPLRSCYSTNKPCQDPTFKMKSISPHRMQTTSSSVHASPLLKGIYSSPVRTSPYRAKLTSRDCFNEWSDIYSSPNRKSPFKLHTNKESPVRSPYAHVASPKSYMRQSFSKEFKRSNFVPSPSKLTFPRRTLEYPDERLSAQRWSPQLDKPRSPHRGLRRCLSFDSSTQPLSRPFYSSKDFDNDFIKLYHKLVCLNKSSLLKGHPCRYCAKNSETSRGHSLSNLAALALSPHRPFLRKRHGDMQSYPHSKRYRDDHAQLKY